MEIRSGYAHTATDIEIHYEDLGNPDDPPVLLIMGLGRSWCSGTTSSARRSSTAATG